MEINSIITSALELSSEIVLAITPDGTIRYVSSGWKKILGFEEARAVGKSIYSFILEKDHKVFRQKLNKAQTDETCKESTRFRIGDASGNIRWFTLAVSRSKESVYNTPVYVAVLKDITALCHAENAYAESEERFSTMMESAKDSIFFKDTDGRYTTINTSVTKFLGKSAEWILGKKDDEIFAAEEAKYIREVDARVFSGETIEDVHTKKIDGKNEVFHFIKAPVLDKNERVKGLLGIARNITQMKSLEKRLQEARKMEAIASLAGGIAHKFNNILFGITGNIDLLIMLTGKDEKMLKYLNAMSESAQRMADMNMQLLSYARVEKYRPTPIRLAKFVEKTLPLIRHTIPSEVDVNLILNPRMPCVEADVSRLQMVFSAIINNAVEAMSEKGCITIRTGVTNVPEKSDRDFADFQPGTYAYLAVEDTGCGMDEETLEKMFEPFFTTKYNGRGLGMATVYGIIRNHNGWVDIETKPGRGTTVTIYLPVKEDS